MGTIAVQAVIDRVQTLLQDATGIRWPVVSELLGWGSDAEREIQVYKPNSYVKNSSVQLQAGTKQSLPDDGILLIDIPRNMGVSGSTPGRAIRIAMREILDSQTPGWHGGSPSAEVVHYTYSPLDPKHYYVYPPQPASSRGYVDMIYAAVPPPLTLIGTINVDDIYMGAVVDGILYRCYSKDAEYAADPTRAAAHKAAFIATMTGKTAAEAATNPNSTAPANPNVTPNSR